VNAAFTSAPAANRRREGRLVGQRVSRPPYARAVLEGEWVELTNVRREVPQQIYAVIAELCRTRGFKVRRQGHKFYLYCPCGTDGAMISVPGTPRNADVAARRLRRAASHCPDQHELAR
jgi:hypothetical protein